MRINRQSLKVIRERSGFSSSRFATAAGISTAHLSNIESGKRQASPELILRMAKVLEVPVMALISDRPPEEISA